MTQEQEDVTQEKGATQLSAPVPNSQFFSAFSATRRQIYCTVIVTISPCDAPPAAVAVTVMCHAPSSVGGATVTKADPGAVAAADVAVTVTVACIGTTAGAVYNPVPSTVPFALPLPLPPVTAQVTVWLVELLTVAVNCC